MNCAVVLTKKNIARVQNCPEITILKYIFVHDHGLGCRVDNGVATFFGVALIDRFCAVGYSSSKVFKLDDFVWKSLIG